MRVEVLENVELHFESDNHTELGSESLTLLKVRYMETSTNTLFQGKGATLLDYFASTFSRFSVGCCINKEKVICYQLEFEINLPMFRLNGQLSSGQSERSVNKCCYL